MIGVHAIRVGVCATFLTCAAATTQAWTEQPARLDTATGSIEGTLTLPAGRLPVPVAVIVAGSGPTDRNGNGPGRQCSNDSLKLLSRALADAGVASVRFDKRGVGASAAAGPREDDLRFEHYVDDARGWVSQLARDTRFTKTALIGHSEGALVGLLAVRRSFAAAYVSIAGPGEPAPVLLRRQLAGRLPPDLSAAAEKVLATLESGAVTSEVPPLLAALFRPSVQPYLISWFKWSPRHEIAALKAPCLLLQGTADLQVQVADAQALQAAQPGCQLALVPGMNHVLKTVPADPVRQLASYADPTLPVAPELVQTIASFLQGRAGADGGASALPPTAPPGSALTRAQSGPLRVALGLTDDEPALRYEWETATASPRLKLIDRARSGDKVTTVVIFEGCTAAPTGSCRLTARFELQPPDGKSVAAGSGVLWSSPPLAGRMMLGAASATLPIGPTWAHGHYAVRVTVTDDVSRQALTLVATFTVEP